MGDDTYDEVNMRWAVRMSVEQLQDFAGWSVIWNWVGRRSQAIKGIFSVFIGVKLAAKIRFGLFIVLLLVQACKIGVSPNRSRCYTYNLPFVEASQISIEALTTGFFVVASTTLP